MTVKYKILSPLQYSGSLGGDYGYEIDGIKSERGYVSKSGAYKAMWRKIEKEGLL